jgi:SAM-dependent methyltransferase
MNSSWKDVNEWEKYWWGNCTNTFNEERKQLVYARRMELKFCTEDWRPFTIDMDHKSVLDIGGGPVSLLLKCINVDGTVVDPCEFPRWIYQRYGDANIHFLLIKGEEVDHHFEDEVFDEVWIYNCLQHTEDPEKILRNAKKVSKLIRLFEWIDKPVEEGHPQVLTQELFTSNLPNGEYTMEYIDEDGCTGMCIYGSFPGNHYEL